MAIGVKVAKGSAQKARARRHFRVRKKVTGTTARPRLVVSRSARHLFVQIVDDSIGQTIVSASTMEDHLRKDSASDKSAKARHVGTAIADRAKEKGITSVVFDRGGNKYHGRVAALAEAARAGGLDF
ncbi:MAG: 50S ribosomal protein L18 [Actinomycetes bacterium]|jgi:large subunit ribosomal protein L18|nr:50S ribosomal protein L18 [Actinomycetota bacterium]